MYPTSIGMPYTILQQLGSISSFIIVGTKLTVMVRLLELPSTSLELADGLQVHRSQAETWSTHNSQYQDWASPDILFEVAWLSAIRILQRLSFPLQPLKFFTLFCHSLFRVKVFRIENTVSLKCYGSEARLGCFHMLALSEMSNGNKKVKIFKRFKHPRSIAIKLPALGFRFFRFILWSALLSRRYGTAERQLCHFY